LRYTHNCPIVNAFVNLNTSAAFQVNPIPTDDFSKVLKSSATGGDSQLKGLVNDGNVDEAAQMAYSILTAVEDADVGNDDKQAVRDPL